MRARVFTLLLLSASIASARPARPKLTAAAAALLAEGPVLLIADDDVIIPVAGEKVKSASPSEAKVKSVSLFEPAPKRLELVAVTPGEGALLAVDDELFRLKGAALSRVASLVGADPAATPDFAVIAGIEDKKSLKLTRDGASKLIPYRRDGRWELERPYLTPDGATALVAVRDYTQPLDAYDLLVVDTKSGALEEIRLSKNFVPGPLRQPLSPTEVALQMFTQAEESEGALKLSEADVVVFDFKSRKLKPAPAALLPGLPSPSKRWSILPGTMAYSDDKRCGGDATALYEQGKSKAARFVLAAGTVVSVLDFLPDESGMIANVLTLKTCKNRGVIIPFKDEDPARWKSFPLPVHPGHLVGRVINY
ncbi:MAG TPA: hypothetical protein VFF06_08585 [Polyangia bacterium]|nr:hypothetical protein [Polyangia bacterium]